jgi:hypothetical protein
MREWVRWEAGSMFHWEDDFTPPLWSFPEPAVYYMMCRHAIAALCAVQPSRPVLWLPTFFCPEVARFCSPAALIREYRDDCRWPEPDWQSLQPAPNDLVLAVNYFGVRGIEAWRDWSGRHTCILIEDHTQDPFSTWALESAASYAVCSLRKTLPVPDGAMLWSPIGLPLPAEPPEGDWKGSVLKLGAMLYKREFLQGTVAADRKPRFREWQLRSERELNEAPLSAISPISEALLSPGVPKRWRERRIENARTLLQALASWTTAKPAFRDWPKGHAPFDVPWVFPSQSERDYCQHLLQQRDIFCPVEWPCDTPDTVATDLSSRILSIPIDHRYTREDMERIAAAVLAADNSRVVAERGT